MLQKDAREPTIDSPSGLNVRPPFSGLEARLVGQVGGRWRWLNMREGRYNNDILGGCVKPVATMRGRRASRLRMHERAPDAKRGPSSRRLVSFVGVRWGSPRQRSVCVPPHCRAYFEARQV